MTVTILQIAEILDLSHTTVSRVLNGRADRYISEATRQRVWDKAKELNYRPNQAARALVTGKTRQIALWMSSLHTAFHAQVVQIVEAQLRESGYQVLIGVLPPTPNPSWHVPGNVDGYLLFEGAHYVDSLPRTSKGTAPKAVSLGGTNFRTDEVDCVGFDLGAGSRDALNHLASQGCRRISYVGTGFEESRLQAYGSFMREEGLREEQILAGSQNRADVRVAVRARLEKGDLPDALFCFNDDVALASYRAARDLGLDIPEQVAITGCDGIDDTEYLDVPLTTIQLPLAEMCRRAWDCLQIRMENPDVPAKSDILLPELIIRASSSRTQR